MRAAIYARVSTDQQGRDQTINSQLSLLQQWVQEQGHTLNSTHIYKDEGYSGARLDRPGLDALRDAVIDGTIDIIAVFSPDRLARKYAYQVVLLLPIRITPYTLDYERINDNATYTTTQSQQPTTTGFRISDALWAVLEPLLPVRLNTHRFGGGRPRVPDRRCADANFFVLRTGCQWEALKQTDVTCSRK